MNVTAPIADEATRGFGETVALPLAQLESDLDLNLNFGQLTLEVWQDAVRLLDAKGVELRQIGTAEIQTARNESLVSGGRLDLHLKSGEIIPLVYYTQSLSASFSELARGIEQLAKGEPFEIKLSTAKTRCSKCARLLPERDGICPACVKRTKTLLRVLGFMRPIGIKLVR